MTAPRARQLRNTKAVDTKEYPERPLWLWSAQPLLVISPFARKNYVDHRVTDKRLSFVSSRTIGASAGSAMFRGDAIAGTLNAMFDFGDAGHNHKLFLIR